MATNIKVAGNLEMIVTLAIPDILDIAVKLVIVNVTITCTVKTADLRGGDETLNTPVLVIT